MGPFGGPADEEVFVNFGLPRAVFYQRLAAIVDRDRNGRHLGTTVHGTLSEACRRHQHGVTTRTRRKRSAKI
ncbi:hypothetical protein CS378_16590 [Rhodococcus ruber]|nr:hypothetical protein CS378_16590 [Rhodococcus ruber]